MKQVVLEKYHCMGNDYLVFDPNKNDLELNAENIKKMCSRHFGIGADGILAGPYLGRMIFMYASTTRTEARRRRAATAWVFLQNICGTRDMCRKRQSPGKRWEARRQFLSQRGCDPCENFDGTSDVLE